MVEDANISVGMSMSASVVAGASSGPSQTLSGQVTSQTPSKDVVSSDPFGPSQTSTSQVTGTSQRPSKDVVPSDLSEPSQTSTGQAISQISSVSAEPTASPTPSHSPGDGSGPVKNGFNPKHIRLGLAAANAKLGATPTASDESGPGSALPTPGIGDSPTSSFTRSPSTGAKSGMPSSVVARSPSAPPTPDESTEAVNMSQAALQEKLAALAAQQATNSAERAKQVDAAQDFFNTASGSSVKLPSIQEQPAKTQNPKRRSVSSGLGLELMHVPSLCSVARLLCSITLHVLLLTEFEFLRT
ncbi:hypothetical protein LENED_007628 [Lentinula edodes]|nr:hypothetical protein LENED_007628 [Lentinula edodes]